MWTVHHCVQLLANKHGVWNIDLILTNKRATNDELCGFKRQNNIGHRCSWIYWIESDSGMFYKGSKDMSKENKIKVCLVGSSGGHLTHLYMLKPFWQDKDRFWVTFDKEDARSLLKGEKMYSCYYPSNRSIKALVINTVKAIKIIPKERPDLIITSGAAPAIPFFYIGKLFGAKTIYIEVFDRINTSTLAGKLCYPVTDMFIVQWEEMKRVYPKAINLGSIF